VIVLHLRAVYPASLIDTVVRRRLRPRSPRISDDDAVVGKIRAVISVAGPPQRVPAGRVSFTVARINLCH